MSAIDITDEASRFSWATINLHLAPPAITIGNQGGFGIHSAYFGASAGRRLSGNAFNSWVN